MTDSSRDNDPNSPVGSEAGNSLRQTRTLQRHCPFQKRTDMKRLVPLSSYCMAKHCSVATRSAMSDTAQLKKCWKIARKRNNLRTELTHQGQLTKYNSPSCEFHPNQNRRERPGGRLGSSASTTGSAKQRSYLEALGNLQQSSVEFLVGTQA